MHDTMVEATLRVVANSLFSQDFGPLVQSMSDLATRGLRHAERLQRLIRRGTTVVIPIHHIHHDPRWWRDPQEFDPSSS